MQRTKPKGLIDLSCAYMYQVHDSFFEKRFCFQIVERALPCLATVTYLASEDAGEYEVSITVRRRYGWKLQSPYKISLGRIG